MVQLTTKKTALVLYAVLLVLPTVVLTALQWLQLMREQEAQLERVPAEIADSSRRLSSEIEGRAQALVKAEGERPFYVYRSSYFPRGTIGADLAFIPSPLEWGPLPEGVLGWFSFNVLKGSDDDLAVFGGGRQELEGWEREEQELREAALEVIRHDRQEGYLQSIARFSGWSASKLPATVAAINLHPEDDISCLRGEVDALMRLAGETMTVNVSELHLRFYLDAEGVPRIIATRRVSIEGNRRLRQVETCIETMGWGAILVQGFFVDPVWYFESVPESSAKAVLTSEHNFIPQGSPEPDATQVEAVTILPVELLHCETYDPLDVQYGVLRVAVNTAEMKSRFRVQSLRFLGVTAMMFLSLAMGLLLLLRSVRRDLEQAGRTENFVAAVTHELRTPLAAIKLYGEMLADGWVRDPKKLEQYHHRIVRETNRLETLIERVLEKGRVTSDEAPPQAGDLNRAVLLVRSSLNNPTIESSDIAYQLTPELPDVLLIPNGVRSILTNLIENARKYAPVDTSDPEAEPILVRTGMISGRVCMEVLDRGPGIPPEERRHIFDAFYRIGNETTRTATGTGLGLHLVALQMRAMRGRIRVLDRDGGGTVFRMTFRKVDDSETDYDVF